ncbi:hypothetical protein Y032_0004g1820 [Ancylostoma ceylanicum]|uniref:Reverse transcriptase domain-containing protein n=1 Tax=Ancylostoma ceylanicum TaxID=53326 RepID=A0A016VVS7_9BILA|nr:hypothetical protein Y032_0004g1820 [Ancylostoma ceylanicum]
MRKLLADHFNCYLEAGTIHNQWKCSKTVLIFKKGDKKDIGNYRPIALLPIPYKLFLKIILNRLEVTLDAYQPTEQAGFRKGFCCMDHIHTVVQLIERCREYTKPIVLTFIDYQKAFDSVETNVVLNALLQAGVDSAYVIILEQCNVGIVTTIQLFDKKLRIPIEKGVRQSDTISPKLFTSALQYAMSRLNWDEKGLSIDGKMLSNLRFADDILLISKNTKEMNQLINELNEVGKSIGLKTNTKKTQTMANQWSDNGTIHLDGIPLQKVDSFVYLRREINMMNDLIVEIGRRRKAAWAAMDTIREITSQIKDMNRRAHIFDSTVLPALCYGAETCTDNKNITTAMRTTHRALEKCLLGTNRWRRGKQGLTSKDLRKESKIRDPLEYMASAKHKWAGHVMRRKDDSNPEGFKCFSSRDLVFACQDFAFDSEIFPAVCFVPVLPKRGH